MTVLSERSVGWTQKHMSYWSFASAFVRVALGMTIVCDNAARSLEKALRLALATTTTVRMCMELTGIDLHRRPAEWEFAIYADVCRTADARRSSADKT